MGVYWYLLLSLMVLYRVSQKEVYNLFLCITHIVHFVMGHPVLLVAQSIIVMSPSYLVVIGLLWEIDGACRDTTEYSISALICYDVDSGYYYTLQVIPFKANVKKWGQQLQLKFNEIPDNATVDPHQPRPVCCRWSSSYSVAFFIYITRYIGLKDDNCLGLMRDHLCVTCHVF